MILVLLFKYKFESLITTYPNPNKSNITIDNVNQTYLLVGEIRITNTLGKEIYNLVMSQQIQDISLSSIATRGLYFITIINNSNKTIVKKKIVLH